MYVIDTSAVVDIAGEVSPLTSYTSDPKLRERIWKNLDDVVRADRVVSPHACQEEFKVRCRTAYERYRPLGLFTPDSIALWKLVKDLLKDVPEWAEDVSDSKYTREPADSYVVALAMLQGRAVVTNEKHKSDRSRNNRRGVHIPDVCDMKGVKWLYLADFIAAEGLTK